MIRNIIIAVLISTMLSTAPAFAGIKYLGSGESMHFDPSQFPAQHKAAYAVFNDKCTKCHSQQRIVTSYIEGTFPISSQVCDVDTMRKTIFRMVKNANRKTPDSITPKDAKSVMDLLMFLMAEATR